ncbi:CoA-binding domain protein [Caenispirillum salinarum AK4]|uniref:CoA-binding domain protein n=1 Tax=Caenispirillum salinarum AK4 TaxID=1238182 RepID=K9HF69_9PROT|nr:CoA-binding protein [Caenispirillum salinarum]EKV27326.1 CoA-binding domain protein [Caenispirillum salinarum AK4]
MTANDAALSDDAAALNAASTDERVKALLTGCRRIAVVGASPKAHRPSNGVLRFLVRHGYDVVAVNPGHAGGTVADVPCHAKLADVPGPVHMVDIFRRSDRAGAVIDEAITLKEEKGIVGIWTQLGVVDDAAAARAAAAGLVVVQNRCPAIELPRLGLG